jgi:hypothetical protein
MLVTASRHVCHALVALALTAACSSRKPVPEAPPEPAAPAVTTPCPTAQACLAEATRARETNDAMRAAEYFGYACEHGDAAGCNSAGTLLDNDPSLQRARFRRACELDEPSGCANLGRAIGVPREALDPAEKGCNLDARTCDSGARIAIDAEAWDRARAMAERGCTDTVDVACGTLGSLLGKGLGGPQDSARSGVALERGCKAGDENACKNWEYYKSVIGPKPAAGDEPGKAAGDLDVPHASLTMGSVSADGFTMRDVACNLEGGGLGALMAGPMLAAAVGARKAELRKCAPKGGEARVLFTMRGGKVDARAQAASPAVEACVVKAMKTVVAISEGTCAVTIDLRQ